MPLVPVSTASADEFPRVIYSLEKLAHELEDAKGNGSLLSQAVAPFWLTYVIIKDVIFEIPASILLDMETVARFLNNAVASVGVH